MEIIDSERLSRLTTFRIGGPARSFAAVKSIEDLKSAVEYAKDKGLPVFVLGGGSNVLVNDKGFDGLVIKMEIMGIGETSGAGQEIEGDLRARLARARGIFQQKNIRAPEALGLQSLSDSNLIFVRAGAGEDWDGFVAWCVERGYGGLENLSLIPGTVGAAPVQNIGAYGVEVGGLIESVEAYDMTTGSIKTFSRSECLFSYRDSVFKREKAAPSGRHGRYAITSVLFRLRKGAAPDISYKDLKEFFEKKSQYPDSFAQVGHKSDAESNTKSEAESQFGATCEGYHSKALSKWKVRFPNGKWSGKKNQRPARRAALLASEPTISAVREAVIAIRTAKLPDVRKVGTAGSFFKNPILSKERFQELKAKIPELSGFPESPNDADARVKIPLAWVIDKVCGLKGKKFGKAGIHDTQALVIVNYGGASFDDVESVAFAIEKAVKEKTGIDIEREVVMA